MTKDKKIETFDELFRYLIDEQMFNGSVIVSENGSPIYTKVSGVGQRGESSQLNNQSSFDTASISKTFTSMAIMMLKEQQKLRVDDAIEKYLADLPYKGITIRNLLTHTSGIPDYIEWFEEYWDRNKIATNQDIIELFLKGEKPELLSKPNEKWHYSNTGYILLAELIEKVSGLSYEEYLQRNIFDPLGMESTRPLSRRMEKEINSIVDGYIYDRINHKYFIPDTIDEHSYVYFLDGVRGDGVINTTAEDLVKWDQGLYSDELVSEETKMEAFKSAELNDDTKLGYGAGLHPDAEAGYGFGWSIEENETSGKILAHGGYCAGFHSFIIRYVDSNKSIIYLSNIDYLDFNENKIHHDIVLELENILFDREIRLPIFPSLTNSTEEIKMN
ncbi:serine hydrolase domain-containing protein [Pseudalkalibacillus hwajinpoensis]|uniref:serine hydrolase domain-containing protein n=1 Tax=Guptibacillus hwajinpoensis TaxID=208199 RepID=UPI00146A3FCF|nr:serine hydrolase domain-containing protein [Pseudalkalibacillus hwajinpoensis]